MLNESTVEIRPIRKQLNSYYHLMLEYQNYIKEKKLAKEQKILFTYRGTKIAFTKKQTIVMKLVAQGLSNMKIAEALMIREPAVKLLIYRLMRYLESILYENIDRFYLVIIAQKLRKERVCRFKKDNISDVV